LWESGEGQRRSRPRFKFEKWWLLQLEFKQLVRKVWNSPVKGENTFERWQNKVRLFHRKARGWSANVEALNRRENDRLSAEYAKLDVLFENRCLNGSEKDRLKFLSEELNKIWSMEEIKARQRARERDIKEGDRNIRYFHVVANQRRRKTTIHKMDDPAGEVETTEEIVEIATSYYKELFKYEARPDIRIEDNFFSGGEKVSSE
jgi:hypothetical protein